MDVLERNPEFAALFSSGMTSRDDKLSLIERIVEPQASPLFTSFLRVLARHDRLDLLPLIFKEAKEKDEVRQAGRDASRSRVHVPCLIAAWKRFDGNSPRRCRFNRYLSPARTPRYWAGWSFAWEIPFTIVRSGAA